MLAEFRDHLKSTGLLFPGSGILLAVSGGPDSMSMLHLFRRTKGEFEFKMEVAHLHHGIRGKEADLEAAFVQEECHRLGIPARFFKFDVPKFASRQKLSLEEAGRRIRHHFFARYAKSRNLDCIAFAHTADDQVETILLNFMRGAGPLGLAGVPPKWGKVIHPVLPFSKADLLRFLRENQLEYRLDGTNEDRLYARNKIRLDILPYLEEQVSGNLRTNLLRTARIFRDEEAWLDPLISPEFQRRFQQLADSIFHLTISPHENLPVALKRRLVRKFLKTSIGSLEGVGFLHVERILDLLLKQPGRRFEFSQFAVERTAEGLAVSKKRKPWDGEMPVKIPGDTAVEPLKIRLRTEVTSNAKGLLDSSLRGKDLKEAFLDWDEVQPPLHLRTRRNGDAFHVIGLGNRGKKLQDYLVDRKVPRVLRDRIPLVVCSRGILWVGGLDVDDRFKVTQKTERVLRLRLVHD